MKTLEELNQKNWYRLLKVMFIIFSCLLLFFYNFYIFKVYNIKINFKELNENKTLVSCLYGQHNTFKYGYNSNSSKDFYPSYKFDYNEYIKRNDVKTRKILDRCYGTDKLFEQDFINPNTYQERYNNYIKSVELTLNLENGNELFRINPIYSVKNAIINIFLYILIGNLFMILIAEIIRRIFYYVITGSIIPNKK